MNILYINHYAGSIEMGMEFRPYYLSREWVKNGHNVTIVGASYSHLRSKQPKDVKEVIDGINYIWIDTPAYQGNGVKRIINMFTFIFKLWCMTSLLARELKPDVVIASSTYPLDTYPAQKVAKKAKAKLIHEVHDLWPLTLIELGGYSKYNPFVFIMQAAENSAYSKSDAVVSILPNAKDHLIEHGLLPGKFYHIPNGIVKEDWEHTEETPSEYKKEIDKLKKDGFFLVCYFGGHAFSNALSFFIEAAALIRDIKVRFILVGDGAEKSTLQGRVKELKLNNVKFLPPVPKRALPQMLSNMDCIYFGTLKNRLYKYGISMNKIYDSMMTAKPIICAIESSNNIVADIGCGITIEPENPQAIVEAINSIQHMSEEERKEMGQRGREAVLKYYEYGTLANLFYQVIRE